MQIARSVRSLADTLATHLEAGRDFFLISFSILFISVTSLHALSKPLWYDELFTLYMSQLPGMDAIWSAVKDGTDLNPPLLYMATRTAHALLGDGPVATRLPALLGFLVMLLCLFFFVARRCGAVYGFAVMLLVTVSGAYAFAYEARAYGLVLGFSGLSLLCWQWAAENQKRRLALFGLAVSLAAALLSHCYAVLIIVPLAMAELVRSISRKRVDWPIWLCLAAASCTVVLYLPLLAANRFVLENVTFQPTLRLLGECYRLLLNPLAAPVISALIIIAAVCRPYGGPIPLRVPPHEIAAAAGFVLVPLFAFIVAKLVSNVFMTRYGLTAVIGIGILFAYFMHRYTVDRRLAGALFTLVFAIWFGAGFLVWMMSTARGNVAAASRTPEPIHAYEAAPEFAEPDIPFVAANGLFFLEADHYGPQPFVARLVYLSDRESALKYTGSDIFDRGFPILRKWFPIRARVEDYTAFVRAHRRFLVFGEFQHPLAWLTKKLLDDGAQLRFLGQYHGSYGENLLLEATMPESKPALPPER
jgi:hypothetical protein